MKAIIVVPTIREENCRQFLEAWKEEFAEHEIFLVEDNPSPTFEFSQPNLRHFSWEDIDRDLGETAWIIPRRTDCVRSYGYLKAAEEEPDLVVTLDDDCLPASGGFLQQHWNALNMPGESEAWTLTGRNVTPRGVPYFETSRKMRCVANHGLWCNVPDYDAVTQLANRRAGQVFEPVDQVIPRGRYFPMCGMNLAFRPEVAPAMYFLLMGRDWEFDRFGDIWCGIFLKRICDHLGLGIRSGRPLVEHQRASNVWANLRKEQPAYEVNEKLWQAVDEIVLSGSDFASCYRELAAALPLEGEYWGRLKQAMSLWAGRFSK